MRKSLSELSEKIPATVQQTAWVRIFGLTKVPMLLFVSPSIVEVSEGHVVVKIPLTRRTKNHLGSMYFGALACGADLAGGFLAVKTIRERKEQLSFVFKDFKADFLKRPEGDVHFRCDDGAELVQLVDEAIRTGERQSRVVHVTATVPALEPDEPVAEFALTLSVKRKSPSSSSTG